MGENLDMGQHVIGNFSCDLQGDIAFCETIVFHLVLINQVKTQQYIIDILIDLKNEIIVGNC